MTRITSAAVALAIAVVAGCTGSSEQASQAAARAQLKAEQAEAAANRARIAAQQAQIAAERARKAVEDATREINRVAEHLDRANAAAGTSD